MTRRRWLAAMGAGLALVVGLAPRAESEERDTVLRTSSPFMGLQRGDRVRVRLRTEDSFRARFLAASAETLYFASDKRLRHERHMAFNAIEGLDRRTGSHGHLLAGALLGIVAGAGIGMLISTSEEGGSTQWVDTVIYGLAGAGSGLVVGSVVGLSVRGDRWAPIWER